MAARIKKLFSSRKFSALFVLAIFALIYPFASALAQNVGGNGGIVPCGGTGDPCTLCHLIVGVSNLVNWGKNILLTAALTGITISGVMYIVSSGDPGMTNKAKSFLQASITGFAIVLSAWLMVNVTLWILSAKSDLGIGMTSWNKFTCSTVSSTGGMPGGTPGSGGEAGSGGNPAQNQTGQCQPTNNGCGGLGGNTNGCDYTSPNLAAKLACIKNKNVGAQIVSVTLNAHSDWCEKCVWSYAGSSYCSHAQNSAHFGGTKCKGTSVGVDLNPSDAVAKAAMDCGFDTVIWKGKELRTGKSASDHTDHVHASVDNKQCGCDYQK